MSQKDSSPKAIVMQIFFFYYSLIHYLPKSTPTKKKFKKQSNHQHARGRLEKVMALPQQLLLLALCTRFQF